MVIRKRLQVQPPGRRGIDKSLVFVIGEIAPEERKKLRGVIFEATTKLDALRTFRDLHRMAKEAVARDEVGPFLDALGSESKTSRDSGPTFTAFADEWVRTCVEGAGLTESQIESDNSLLKNHLKPFFGNRHLREIDARQIDRYKASKRNQEHQYGEGYRNKTINNHLAVLHRIFEKAIEYGIVEKNPVTKRAWLPGDSTPEDGRAWWTPEEEAKAVKCLTERWYERNPQAYVTLLTQLVVGLRFSEIRALEKRDLDLTVPGIHVRRSMARKAIVSVRRTTSLTFSPRSRRLDAGAALRVRRAG